LWFLDGAWLQRQVEEARNRGQDLLLRAVEGGLRWVRQQLQEQSGGPSDGSGLEAARHEGLLGAREAAQAGTAQATEVLLEALQLADKRLETLGLDEDADPADLLFVVVREG
jgi:hypothetical protein